MFLSRLYETNIIIKLRKLGPTSGKVSCEHAPYIVFETWEKGNFEHDYNIQQSKRWEIETR